tara:strand:+ start:1152 stop:1364 length:213 start_codon:yes stop_codon:yes gene_type:complete
MSALVDEAEDILEKNVITVKDYKRFREIGRVIEDKDNLYFSSFDEGMFQRLPEIAKKEGNYDWLEPEDDD